MKAAEDGLLYLHPWVINDWVECGTVQLSLGEMDHWRRSGGVWRPSYSSRLPSCKRTWKMYERCVYPKVWVQAYCMCHCKSAPGNGGGTCGCERLTFVVSGRLSCSIVDVWWEPTVLPIDPLMGARCRWSQTGHAWCINSTAWAWGWGGVGWRGEEKQRVQVFLEGRWKMNGWIWPKASQASRSPCCLRVGWGAVWDPLRSLCKWPPNRIRRPSGHCSQSCRNPVKTREGTVKKARRILSHR